MSSDGGAVWTSLDTFLYEGGCCLAVPESGHVVIAGGNTGVMPDPLVICVSRDSGRNWTRHVLTEEFGMARALASAPGLIYCGGQAGTAGAVFVSDDYGASWKRSAAPPARVVRGIAVHPAEPGRAYAVAGDGLYLTSDAGETWTRIHTATGLRAVRFFPGCPDTVFAAGASGVLVSGNGGATWQEFNDGLANTDVSVLEFADAAGPRLVAGTMGNACFGWSFSTGVESGIEHQVSGVMRVTPNPMRAGFATVRWDMTQTSAVWDRVPSLAIYNASGRRVLESAIYNLQPAISFDLRGLSPGVYLLKLTAGSYTATHKLVIQR